MPDAGNPERRFAVTESAARRIAKLRQDEPGAAELMMRVAVLGGGCSGFQYKFEFDQALNDDDHVFERDGVTVVVDDVRSEEHTSELQSLMRISYAVFCLK